MNIYDEAIKELKCVWNGNDLLYPSKAIKALERAKKVEELLRMYQENSVIVMGDITIKMLEKELEEL